MLNRRKRILFTFLGGIMLLLAGSISASYAQKPLDFTGTWITQRDGKNAMPLTLAQTGDQVTGSYTGNGKIEGTVSGKVLRFKWQSDSGSGSGRFVMEEKQRQFSGTYNRGENPDDVDATWSGQRVVSPEWIPGGKVLIDKVPLPIPGKKREGAPEPMSKEQQAELDKKEAEYEEAQKNAPATFDGVWQIKSGEKIQYPEFLLQQAGDKVTGRLFASRPDLGVIKDGIVDHNTLRFQIWRPRAMPPSRIVFDQQLGIGEFVMSADGRSFTGTILGAAMSGTLITR